MTVHRQLPGSHNQHGIVPGGQTEVKPQRSANWKQTNGSPGQHFGKDKWVNELERPTE